MLSLGVHAAAALDLSVPSGARKTAEIAANPGVYALPTGAWEEELGLPTLRVEGGVRMQAFRLEGSGFTTFQLVEPLRDQITGAGYRVLLDCPDTSCGGFDFRFATQVLPPPDMYVQLSDYHFLSAVEDATGAVVSVLASRDGQTGYIQITRVNPLGMPGTTAADATPLAPAAAPVSPVMTGALAEMLETLGHAVLSGVEFGSGSTELVEGTIPVLEELAAYLKANPQRRVLFVGHTDATGSLEANEAVSLRRAAAVTRYMRERHGIPESQIGAEGVGYLAPVASNLSAEGREANRRVEVVLVSTE
ncbi:OmpA family protein [Cognatishimia sp. F0-27]|nr:OmpA family protein [Cognatishimia sp. F0-27]MCC1491056.1 OmpA family protein [Cognatishimia sp. F0-27]